MAYGTRNITFEARFLWFIKYIEQEILHWKRASCGLWPIERGTLHLKHAFS